MEILNIDPNNDDEYAEDAEIEAEIEEDEAGLRPKGRLETLAKRKSFKVGVAVATLYTLVLIGETIGGLLSLNGAKPLEYGQGVTAAVACDQNGLQVAAIGRTENIETTPAFYLDSLKVTGVSDTCINKIFKISIFDVHGNAVNLGYKNMPTGSSSGDNATYVRLYISRQNNDSGGLDWRVFPSTSFSNPPSEDGLTICGGDYDLSDQINYDYGDSIPKPGCPVNDYLTHWRGYITLPGTDDGNEHKINFSLKTTGQAVLQIGGDDIINERGDGAEKTITSDYSMLKGSAYPIDLWVQQGTANTHKTILSWDESSSSGVIPSSVFQWDSSLAVKISSSEGNTDYTVSSTSSSPNDRNFIIHFNRPIQTDVPHTFTIETSRA